MNYSNPLAKHFRQPAIFLKLPSQGQYWPEDALTLPAHGELPVYPMTTKDEITLRTPDALINGSGVVSVLQSCIPAIVDPWRMPSVDVDACLIAIRIASYGTEMEINVTCPHCNHQDRNSIDLNTALDHISMPDYSQLVDTKELTIKLKPQNYFSVNRTNSITYEEQRILSVLNQDDISAEDKERSLKEITDKLIELNVENLSHSTEYILMSDGVKVNNFEFIKEFYSNTSGALIKQVRDHLTAISESAGIKPYINNCSECDAEFKTEITFDYSNFFANGS
jgi:hypothetical protein